MDVLKILFLLLLLSSCSRLEYLTKQGIGQVKLLTQSTPYADALASKEYSASDKQKIKKIQTYKKYFYQYFNLPAGDIYSKVYKLDQEAVTYLVIASPFKLIKARKECFPFVGCFPYLGFFSKKDALEHSDNLKRNGEHVWVRPVYAYSTLGNFTDPILSSFFYYDDYQLANLIFHELFHTILFVQDEVELNENMANFFAEIMTAEYFANDKQYMLKHGTYKVWLDRGMALMVKWAKELNIRYKLIKSTKREPFEAQFAKYKLSVIDRDTEKYCKDSVNKSCWLKTIPLNNAILAAYMTYEGTENKILELYDKTGLSLKEFFSYIKDNYKQLL